MIAIVSPVIKNKIIFINLDYLVWQFFKNCYKFLDTVPLEVVAMSPSLESDQACDFLDLDCVGSDTLCLPKRGPGRACSFCLACWNTELPWTSLTGEATGKHSGGSPSLGGGILEVDPPAPTFLALNCPCHPGCCWSPPS